MLKRLLISAGHSLRALCACSRSKTRRLGPPAARATCTCEMREVYSLLCATCAESLAAGPHSTAWLGIGLVCLRCFAPRARVSVVWCATPAAAEPARARGMARWAVTAAAAAAAVGGASVQNIALVWWTSGSSSPAAVNGTAAGSGGAPPGTPRGTSPFAVLFIGCLYFLLTFCVLIGLRAGAAGGDWAMYLPSHDPVRVAAARRGVCRRGGCLRFCAPTFPPLCRAHTLRRRKTCCARAAAARPSARAAAPSRPSGGRATATPTGSGR